MKIIKISSISITLIIIFVINAVLQYFPITNVIGYDFAAVNGLLLALGSTIITNKILKNTDDSILSILLRKSYLFVSLFFIPFIISILSTVFIQDCPYCLGVQFYLLICIPAIIHGIAITVFSKQILNKFTFILIILIYLIIICIPIAEIYLNPQIYFYNPLIGFYPGTIYDEDISIDRYLLIYQLFWFALSLIAIFTFSKIQNKSKTLKLVFATIIIIIAGLFVINKPELGFATNNERMESILTEKTETEHFEIFYLVGTDKDKVKLAAFEHEYYYSLLSDELEIYPKKISSYLFKNREQKRKYFGAGNADVAKPWLNQIYLEVEGYGNTLKHELVHIFGASIGTTPFKVAKNVNFAMIEGFAMAYENDFDEKPVHYAAKMAKENEYNIALGNLFSGFSFFSVNSSMAYTYAGSFVKYLNDKYGMDKVKKLYSTLDFEGIYNKSINELDQEYNIFLDSLDYQINKNYSQLYFGYKPITKKICLRYSAELNKKAEHYFSIGAYEKALELYDENYEYSGSYGALRGKVYSLNKLERYSETAENLESEYDEYDSTAYQFSLEMNYANALAISGDSLSADSVYKKLFSSWPKIEYKNFAYLRLQLLKKSKLRKYLKGSIFDKYKILTEIYRDTGEFEYIPTLVRLSERLNESYRDFIQNIEIADDNIESIEASEALMELSKYSFKNMDFDKAEKFALLGKTYTKDEIYAWNFDKQLKKVRWIKERIIEEYGRSN